MNGVTFQESETEKLDRYAYMGVMNHAWFGVVYGPLDTDNPDATGYSNSLRYGLALGTSTGTHPDIQATWSGVMVGAPTDSDLNWRLSGNVLQGDATLTMYVDPETVINAAFTDIKRASGSPYSTRSVYFSEVSVRDNGTFGYGDGTDYLQGAFYGPAHEEIAGVFEAQGIFGAFGAKRQ